jgi:hypothetical protein
MSLSSEDHKRNANEAYASELHFSVTELLGNRIQTLSIVVNEEGVILDGVCDSFHTKQLVQEIVTKSTSRRVVSNLIAVRDLQQ